MKHQLRSDKFNSFIKFKYIVETMLTKEHHKNKDLLLALIVIAS